MGMVICQGGPQSTYIGRNETGSVYLPTQLERNSATLLVRVNIMRGGGRAGLILPSSLNVRQKAAVATLCTLWGGPGPCTV